MHDILNKVYSDSSDSYYIKLSKYLDTNTKKFIITANPETIMIAKDNKEFKKVLKSDVEIIPDGIGIIYAAKILKIKLKERITGYDTMVNLFKLANQKKKSIYLFGSEEEVVQKCVDKIKKEYPKIVIKGFSNGYVKDKDKVFKEIIKKEPDICLVALGIPQQELLINKYFDKAKKGIFIGVGGSFDVYSETKKRAPKLFIKLNLEWLYRLLKEPSRIKRFYNNNIKFIAYVFKNRKNN